LQSVLRQQVLPTEIVIADDGSDEKTKQVIDRIRVYSPVPIIHVWQPDEGFRLASIRNKAIAKTTGEYIINIDGDVLLNKHFIHDHLRLARQGTFIAGVRTYLPPLPTEKHMDEKNRFPSFYTSCIKKRIHAFRCYPLALLFYKFRHSKTPYKYVTGCNMSFWKKDLLKINGYNEVFQGWGGEDCDIAVRLSNAGVKQYFLQFYAVLFHLYHPENDRSSVIENNALLLQSINNKLTYLEQGIDKYV
jgi:glycosyltransferase involved in cell wall biosynthesis